LETLDARFSGTKLNRDNSLIWPRGYAYAFGYIIDSDVIPNNVKDAQSQLAYESATTPMWKTNDGNSVKKEKVDVIEVEYTDGNTPNPQPIFARVNAILRPLFKAGGGLSVIRS
jgi:hypothetical protein